MQVDGRFVNKQERDAPVALVERGKAAVPKRQVHVTAVARRGVNGKTQTTSASSQ